jgi:ligand-binding SRPBCC domain-containing protein
MKPPDVSVHRVKIEYQGRSVTGRQLKVSSRIKMPIELVWQNVQTPELLKFVAKGMITFSPVNGDLPKQWQKGETYGVKMFIFGFLPFGSTHYLSIEKIDPESYQIATKEWDNQAKVWNHTVILTDLGDGSVRYEDSIEIYGGLLTSFITSFARRFYIHRQKRWQIVAQKDLKFG